MSQCGVSIPLDDIAAYLIDKYGSTFATEVIKHLDLTRFVTVKNGKADNLTLTGGVIVDEAVKAVLCSILQDCIAQKIAEVLGCDTDNYVIDFSIDNEDKQLVIKLKGGETYKVSINDLKEVLGATAGGIKSGELTTKEGGGGKTKTIIRVINNDGSEVDIDVSKLVDLRIEGGEVVGGNIIRLVRSDGKKIDINVSALTTKDTMVIRGEIVNGRIIRLHKNDNTQVDIEADTLVPNSPYIVSGVFVERDGGYWLDFTRNDNTKVNVEMTAIIDKIAKTTFDKAMDTGYRINTQDADYTVSGDDFNGRTIIRADVASDQSITVPKPATEDFVGKSIIIRKTDGVAGTFVTLVAGEGVSLLPEDATLVRRVGSSVTLVYVGNGVYDVFGELP